MMTINLNVNFENAPDWHFDHNIFGGSSDKASSGSSSDSNLNEADFEEVNEDVVIKMPIWCIFEINI